MSEMPASAKPYPPVGEEVLYTTREAAERHAEYPRMVARWYSALVIAWDNGEPVVRTEKGHYHRLPRSGYVFKPKGDPEHEAVEDIGRIIKPLLGGTPSYIAQEIYRAGYRKLDN